MTAPTPTQYARDWEAYRDQAQAITAKCDALAIRIDTQARDLGELAGFSGTNILGSSAEMGRG